MAEEVAGGDAAKQDFNVLTDFIDLLFVCFLSWLVLWFAAWLILNPFLSTPGATLNSSGRKSTTISNPPSTTIPHHRLMPKTKKSMLSTRIGFWQSFFASGKGSMGASVIPGIENQKHLEQCNGGRRGFGCGFGLSWSGSV
jgi:hypothetical protein